MITEQLSSPRSTDGDALEPDLTTDRAWAPLGARLRPVQRKIIEEFVAYVRRYGQRCCCRRRWRVTNGDDRSSAVYYEVVDQVAVAIDRLRPDAGRPGSQIRCLQLWDVPLGPAEVEPPAHRSGNLGKTRGPIGAGHLPKAFVPQQLEDRCRFDLASAIALAATPRRHLVRSIRIRRRGA